MAYRNPLAWDRHRRPGLYEFNPDAEIPMTVPYCASCSQTWFSSNGKCWDDSEVSDEEMDRLIALQNMQAGIEYGNIMGERDVGSSIRFFRP